MRVLHVAEYVSGGLATYIKEVISYQITCNEITEIGLVYSKLKSEELNFPSRVKEYKYSYFRNPRYFIKALLSIYRAIKNFNPDIIHVHSSFAGLFVRTIYFFKKKDVKIIYCPHGWSFLIEENYFKKKIYAFVELILSIKTDLIINISNYELNGSVRYGIPKNKSVLVYNGINEVKRISKKEVSLDSEDKIKIGFIGRFDKVKGVDILIDIFKNNTFNNLQLYLIGGSVLGDLSISIPQNIKYLGWINNNEIDSYILQFDAIIIPSRGEGFGLVALEAMKNAVPIIASNRGALPELIEHGVNGYIFDINNLNELKEILLSLNKQELKRMGLNGYNLFRRKFTSDKMNKLILYHYKKLLNKV
ncbi:glycosyltransferase [Geobacillus stearothermophilus]|uniref:glycosyltransferase n=1 Tax=Geobacillus stearothermophilus TaxID=1422 RepID=UPI002E2108C6|nr:glycosyltransferase [Geobacillus stearothermophilus]MED4270805.1 glycosyltransferase [Geobacillus stearothermophilus]